MRLTDTWLRNAKPAPTRRDLNDAACRGLIVRIHPGGAKSFIYRYGAERKVLTLGEYPDMTLAAARAQCEEARRLLKAGTDPRGHFDRAKEVEREAGTVAELVDEWQTQYADKHRKLPEQPKALLAKNLPKWFLGMKAKDVVKRDVVLLLRAIPKDSIANDIGGLLKQIFKWGANEADFLPATPLAGLGKRGKEQPRERTLTDAEVKTVWNKLPTAIKNERGDDGMADMSPRVGYALKFLLLTAQRRGETAMAKWSDIDLVSNTWVIPKENSKTGVAHTVPLAPAAVEVLTQLRAISDREDRGDCPFVFPSHHSKLKAAEPMTERAFTRAIAENRDVFGLPHFTPHDFRRTARTGMAKVGVADAVAERVLNHKLQGMLAVYNRHDYADEKREALVKWAEHVTATVTTAEA